jgi:hypothetical protein
MLIVLLKLSNHVNSPSNVIEALRSIPAVSIEECITLMVPSVL